MDSRNTALENTLILGAGPAAIQVSVMLKRGWTKKLGIVSRESAQWLAFQQQYDDAGQVSVVPAKPILAGLAGHANFDVRYASLASVTNQWQTLILCVPADSYRDVIEKLPLQRLDKIKRVVLLSPSFGSHLIVSHQFEHFGFNVEIICLSTYFAATKGVVLNDGNSSRVNVITKAHKKRIYISSYCSENQREQSDTVSVVSNILNSVNVKVKKLTDCFSVEARSITAYVHPPLFVNNYSLDAILPNSGPPKYMYKLFPEGPITPAVIKEMRLLWQEISTIVTRLGASPINLLQFLNDDNYPVLDESIPRENIERFVSYSSDKQEYLLYARYSSILIDPYSQPNEAGRYFDFSAVPFPKSTYYNGRLKLPRVPLEDMKAIYVFQYLAQALKIKTPCISQISARFENWYGRNSRDPNAVESLTKPSLENVGIILTAMKKSLSTYKEVL